MYKESIKKLLRKVFRPQIVKAEISVLTPSKLLAGKKAIVTGGTSGIGYQISKSFLNAGAIVLITGRYQDRIDAAIERIKGEIPDARERVFGLVMDINDIPIIETFMRQAISILDARIDILVNNAGIEGGNLNSCTEEEFEAIINTNARGPFFLSRSVARYMIANGIKGNILNICSSSSLRPVNSAYGMSKWAVHGFTQGLAKMLIPYGIVVNGIAPGMTATPMLKKQGSDEDLWFPESLAERFVVPEEVANMAVIMVSGMCRMVVGDTLFMTGGSGLLYNEDENYAFQ